MSLSAIRASNAKAFASLGHSCLVAVFVGGTAGIGRAMAQAFATSTKGSTLVLVGRSKESAEQLFSSLREAGAEGQYEFFQCDATLMNNVKKTSDDILSRHPKINYLVCTQGYLTLDGYTPTTEGIDKKLALNYYSRFRFFRDLLPALQRGQDSDGIGKAMTVLAPGKGGPIDDFIADFGLKDHYSVSNAANTGPTYNDLMMEKFASLNPSLSFVHAYPGAVGTDALTSSNSKLLALSGKLLMPLAKKLMTTPDECAQFMWHSLHSSERGAFRTGTKGEDLERKGYFGTAEQKEKLWEHTITVTSVP